MSKKRKIVIISVILLIAVIALAVYLFQDHSTAQGDSARSKPYVASVLRDPYHKSSCRWAKKIHTENLVGYDNKRQAEADGHRPCKVCKP